MSQTVNTVVVNIRPQWMLDVKPNQASKVGAFGREQKEEKDLEKLGFGKQKGRGKE